MLKSGALASTPPGWFLAISVMTWHLAKVVSSPLVKSEAKRLGVDFVRKAASILSSESAFLISSINS